MIANCNYKRVSGIASNVLRENGRTKLCHHEADSRVEESILGRERACLHVSRESPRFASAMPSANFVRGTHSAAFDVHTFVAMRLLPSGFFGVSNWEPSSTLRPWAIRDAGISIATESTVDVLPTTTSMLRSPACPYSCMGESS